jgi:hypothetical protein
VRSVEPHIWWLCGLEPKAREGFNAYHAPIMKVSDRLERQTRLIRRDRAPNV